MPDVLLSRNSSNDSIEISGNDEQTSLGGCWLGCGGEGGEGEEGGTGSENM